MTPKIRMKFNDKVIFFFLFHFWIWRISQMGPLLRYIHCDFSSLFTERITYNILCRGG